LARREPLEPGVVDPGTTDDLLFRRDDFDPARQQFEAIEASPLSTAILIRHALKSFGFHQYGLVLHGRSSFPNWDLGLLIHALSVTLKARLD